MNLTLANTQCSSVRTFFKQGRGASTHYQTRARTSSHVRAYGVSVQSNLFLFRNKKWMQNKISVQIQTSTVELNQEEVTALSHHRAQFCAVGDRLPTTSRREIHIGGRRWYVVGCSRRNPCEPKIFSKEFTRVLRLEPNVYDVDGACLWTSVSHTESSGKVPSVWNR